MPRNFLRRVEVVFPLKDAEMEAEVLRIAQGYLSDNEYAVELRVRGNYVAAPKRGTKSLGLQDFLVSQSIEKTRRAMELAGLGGTAGKPKDQGEAD